MNESTASLSTRPREVLGFFQSPEALFDAVDALERAGFDKADISVLGRESLTRDAEVSGYNDTHEASEDSTARRQPVVDEPDVRQVRALATGMTGYMAAAVAAGITVLSGGAAVAALGAAAAAGLGAGAVVHGVGEKLSRTQEDFLRDQLEKGGIILWVHTADGEKTEEKAIHLLNRHGAADVRSHDVP